MSKLFEPISLTMTYFQSWECSCMTGVHRQLLIKRKLALAQRWKCNSLIVPFFSMIIPSCIERGWFSSAIYIGILKRSKLHIPLVLLIILDVVMQMLLETWLWGLCKVNLFISCAFFCYLNVRYLYAEITTNVARFLSYIHFKYLFKFNLGE